MSRLQIERADQAGTATGLDHDPDRYRAALTGAAASEAFTRSFR